MFDRPPTCHGPSTGGLAFRARPSGLVLILVFAFHTMLGLRLRSGGFLLAGLLACANDDRCTRLVCAVWAEPLSIGHSIKGRIQASQVVWIIALPSCQPSSVEDAALRTHLLAFKKLAVFTGVLIAFHTLFGRFHVIGMTREVR